MPASLKKRLKNTLLRFGYIVRHVHQDETGHDPFRDMHRLTNAKSGAILFDVGANVGQTVELFRERFTSPVIHSFEPSPSIFAELKQRTRTIPNLHVNNCGLGARADQLTFIEYDDPTHSSFRPLDEAFVGTDQTTGKVQVEVRTVDDYCAQAGITHIDVLKTDTQGFDFEVLQGAKNMLEQRRIHLIYIELQLLETYVGVITFEDVYRFLKNIGFLPMAFYKQTHHRSYLAPLAEIDALFIDPQWKRG
jgi:FkbM family methyltransferase